MWPPLTICVYSETVYWTFTWTLYICVYRAGFSAHPIRLNMFLDHFSDERHSKLRREGRGEFWDKILHHTCTAFATEIHTNTHSQRELSHHPPVITLILYSFLRWSISAQPLRYLPKRRVCTSMWSAYLCRCLGLWEDRLWGSLSHILQHRCKSEMTPLGWHNKSLTAVI